MIGASVREGGSVPNGLTTVGSALGSGVFEEVGKTTAPGVAVGDSPLPVHAANRSTPAANKDTTLK